MATNKQAVSSQPQPTNQQQQSPTWNEAGSERPSAKTADTSSQKQLVQLLKPKAIVNTDITIAVKVIGCISINVS